MTKVKPPAPLPKRKRAPPAPITGVSVGEPTQVAALARFLLPLLKRTPLRLVVGETQADDTLPCEQPHDGAPRPRSGG